MQQIIPLVLELRIHFRVIWNSKV